MSDDKKAPYFDLNSSTSFLGSSTLDIFGTSTNINLGGNEQQQQQQQQQNQVPNPDLNSSIGWSSLGLGTEIDGNSSNNNNNNFNSYLNVGQSTNYLGLFGSFSTLNNIDASTQTTQQNGTGDNRDNAKDDKSTLLLGDSISKYNNSTMSGNNNSSNNNNNNNNETNVNEGGGVGLITSQDFLNNSFFSNFNHDLLNNSFTNVIIDTLPKPDHLTNNTTLPLISDSLNETYLPHDINISKNNNNSNNNHSINHNNSNNNNNNKITENIDVEMKHQQMNVNHPRSQQQQQYNEELNSNNTQKHNNNNNNNNNRYNLKILKQPSPKIVYQRLLKPDLVVLLTGGNEEENNNLFVDVTLIRNDNEMEIQGVLTGDTKTKIKDSQAVFKKLKILATTQMHSVLFRLKFSLLRYNGQSFDPLDAEAISNPIEVFSHTNYVNPLHNAPPPPVIREVIPEEGTKGTRVAIIGNNFVDSQNLKVKFGNIIITPQFHEECTLLFTIPDCSGLSRFDISVTNDGHHFCDSRVKFNYIPNPN